MARSATRRGRGTAIRARAGSRTGRAGRSGHAWQAALPACRSERSAHWRPISPPTWRRGAPPAEWRAYAAERHGVREGEAIEPQQARRHRRRHEAGDHDAVPVDGVVRRVLEPAVDFVADHDRGQQVGPRRAGELGRGERDRNVVARVAADVAGGGVDVVVEVENADQRAVEQDRARGRWSWSCRRRPCTAARRRSPPWSRSWRARPPRRARRSRSRWCRAAAASPAARLLAGCPRRERGAPNRRVSRPFPAPAKFGCWPFAPREAV